MMSGKLQLVAVDLFAVAWEVAPVDNSEPNYDKLKSILQNSTTHSPQASAWG
jgi:hypothetical protein